jgi:hypothetical protein
MAIYVGPAFIVIYYDELATTLKDKVEMGLTKEPIKLPFGKDVNLPKAKE